VSVTLSYLNGVSNWGPTGAAGVAEIVGREGEVRLTATGLPRLTGERYYLWILDTRTTDRFALGAFNATEAGVGRLDLVLSDAVPDESWDLLMVTVEAEGPQPKEPGTRHSIAGRIPPHDPTGGSAKPAELPNTGGPVPSSAAATPLASAAGQPMPVAWIVGGVIALVLVGLLGFGLGRRASKKGSS
jgi:hypothetical protein